MAKTSLPPYASGLRREYEVQGHPFVDADGCVRLPKPTSWESLLTRIFLKLAGDLKGYKFSKAIYQHLLPMVPNSRLLVKKFC